MKKLIAIALVAAALTGCGKPEDKFVGKWIGKVEFSKEAIDALKGMMTPDRAAEMEKEISSTVITLELKKDKAYDIVTTAKSNTNTVSGTWTLSEDGKSLTLSAPTPDEATKAKAKAAGLSDEQIKAQQGKAMAYVVSEDGKTLTTTEAQGGLTLTLSFTRQ